MAARLQSDAAPQQFGVSNPGRIRGENRGGRGLWKSRAPATARPPHPWLELMNSYYDLDQQWGAGHSKLSNILRTHKAGPGKGAISKAKFQNRIISTDGWRLLLLGVEPSGCSVHKLPSRHYAHSSMPVRRKLNPEIFCHNLFPSLHDPQCILGIVMDRLHASRDINTPNDRIAIACKALDDYETKHGANDSSEHRKLQGEFLRAVDAYLDALEKARQRNRLGHQS